jgi:hypothetical protein
MVFIKNNFFVLIILILLQSCSGGRIGNFLDSSFKDIEEEKIKEDIKNNLKNKVVIKSGRIEEKNKNIEEKKIKEDIKNNLKNKVLKKSEKKSKNNKITSDKNISFQNREYKPKSYKIIFILKDVDPKDPTEDLRTILRNSDVNFEIEKIERYFDPKNKTIKSN